MTSRAKFFATVGLLLVLGGIGIADMLYSKDDISGILSFTQGTREPSDAGTTLTLPSGEGVAKRQAVNIADLLATIGYTTTSSKDSSMLSQVTGSAATVNALTLLKENDRIGSVMWIDSVNVKTLFNQLKDALLAAFSPKVQDLEDTTKVEPGSPIINILTFLDPSLSAERLTFVRIGDRLMEFHTATGKESDMQGAIDALSSL